MMDYIAGNPIFWYNQRRRNFAINKYFLRWLVDDGTEANASLRRFQRVEPVTAAVAAS